jgi:2-keto-4-pentenoate hydratase
MAANDPATQRRLNLAGPVVGALWEAQVGDAELDLARRQLPGVEAELALVIGKDVTANDDSNTLRAAIKAVAIAAELIDLDQRFDDLEKLVGRNFLHAAYVMAQPRAFDPGALSSALVKVEKNGVLEWQMPLAFILGDPADIVRCAAANLAMLGARLRAGDVLSSGVITPLPVWVQPGDRVTIDAGGLGALTLVFPEIAQ